MSHSHHPVKHSRARATQRQTEAESGIHVAIIMDGNGRWANARGRPRTAGHIAGARVVRKIVELNPLTGLIETVRWMMLSGYLPSAGAVLAAVVETAVVVVVGWFVFARLETTMADEI